MAQLARRAPGRGAGDRRRAAGRRPRDRVRALRPARARPRHPPRGPHRLGLPAALESLAARAPLPVTIEGALPRGRPCRRDRALLHGGRGAHERREVRGARTRSCRGCPRRATRSRSRSRTTGAAARRSRPARGCAASSTASAPSAAASSSTARPAAARPCAPSSPRDRAPGSGRRGLRLRPPRRRGEQRLAGVVLAEVATERGAAAEARGPRPRRRSSARSSGCTVAGQRNSSASVSPPRAGAGRARRRRRRGARARPTAPSRSPAATVEANPASAKRSARTSPAPSTHGRPAHT